VTLETTAGPNSGALPPIIRSGCEKSCPVLRPSPIGNRRSCILPSLTGSDQADGTSWTVTFSDTMQTPPRPLIASRNITESALAYVTVPLSGPGLLHRLVDPDAGDTIMVVTAPPPIRGFIKRQDFVEMSLLESIHGVAVRPNSDDVTAEIAPDKIILGRPGGLTLSSAGVAAQRAPAALQPVFDVAEWRKNQQQNFAARQDALDAVALLEPQKHTGIADLEIR